MRNNSLLPIRATFLVFALSMLGTTSCTKENTNPDRAMSEEAMRVLRAGIIGSWELMEKDNCQGTYQISNLCALTVSGNCQSPLQAIQELTSSSLIVKEGVVYYKYRKLN